MLVKAKNKNAIDDNFENLKAQMLKKKNLAESIDEELEKPNLSKDEIKVATETEEIENPTVDLNDDRNNYNIVIKEDKKPESVVNMSKIIIKKLDKPEQPKRITYYLKPETIKKIDKYSKMAGMGKSEFVQKLLEEILNNLEIEN